MRTEKDKNDMKAIKFRGKSNTGVWIYGDLIKGIYKDSCYIIQKCTFQSSDNSFLKINNHFLVNPETVGQFTGLLDKNGKEIYEGDVCCERYEDKCEENGCGETYNEVTFQKGSFGTIGETTGELLPFYEYPPTESELAGNIHDNPSLLSE